MRFGKRTGSDLWLPCTGAQKFSARTLAEQKQFLTQRLCGNDGWLGFYTAAGISLLPVRKLWDKDLITEERIKVLTENLRVLDNYQEFTVEDPYFLDFNYEELAFASVAWLFGTPLGKKAVSVGYSDR